MKKQKRKVARLHIFPTIPGNFESSGVWGTNRFVKNGVARLGFVLSLAEF